MLKEELTKPPVPQPKSSPKSLIPLMVFAQNIELMSGLPISIQEDKNNNKTKFFVCENINENLQQGFDNYATLFNSTSVNYENLHNFTVTTYLPAFYVYKISIGQKEKSDTEHNPITLTRNDYFELELFENTDIFRICLPFAKKDFKFERPILPENKNNEFYNQQTLSKRLIPFTVRFETIQKPLQLNNTVNVHIIVGSVLETEIAKEIENEKNILSNADEKKR